MLGTNKLCMKGIYLPTWHYFTVERRLQKIYTVIYTVRHPLEEKTCFITCVFIYIIYRFYTDFSLFRQIKRQDTVTLYRQILIIHRRSWHGLATPLFSNFLLTNLFSIKFLHFFIISSLFPYFNLFVSIFIQFYVNSNLHVSTL